MISYQSEVVIIICGAAGVVYGHVLSYKDKGKVFAE